MTPEERLSLAAMREIVRVLPKAADTPVLSLEWLVVQCESLQAFRQLLLNLSDLPVEDIPDRALNEQRVALQAYARLVLLVDGYCCLCDLASTIAEIDDFPDNY